MTSKFAIGFTLVLGALAVTQSGCGSTSANANNFAQPAMNQPDLNRPQSSALRPAPVPEPLVVEPPLVARAGTRLQVRFDRSIDTRSSRVGDRVTGALTAPVMADGRLVVPAGSRVYGVVRASRPSGRFKGRAVLGIGLESVEVAGAQVPVNTDSVVRTSGGHKKRNFSLIGGGAGLGALIGGLAGGGRGALIGAGAGAGAGTAGAALTGKKQVQLPAESLVVFQLRQPLEIQAGQQPVESARLQ